MDPNIRALTRRGFIKSWVYISTVMLRLNNATLPWKPRSKRSSRTRCGGPARGLPSNVTYAGVVRNKGICIYVFLVVSLNYCSQNGGDLYRAPYYNGNPNMGPCITGNSDQSSYIHICIHIPISIYIYTDMIRGLYRGLRHQCPISKHWIACFSQMAASES